MFRQRSGVQSIAWKSHKSKIYLNWGGAERIREDVIAEEDRFRKWQHLYEDDPKGSIAILRKAIAQSRKSVGRIIKCSDSKHIIFATGSEEALQYIFFAHHIIPYGARVVATDCEFYGIYSKIAPPRYDVAIANIWGLTTKDEIINAIEEKVDDSTRLLIISHVCYNSGIALPISEITKRVKAKNPDVLVLVDGAQAVGQISVDVQALGCDFYVGDGHKWLLGPDQTGFLYIRSPQHLELVARDVCSAFAVHPSLNHEKGSRSGAVAYELAALGMSLELYLKNNMIKEIQARAHMLAQNFQSKMRPQTNEYFDIVPTFEEGVVTGTVSLSMKKKPRNIKKLIALYDELLANNIHCAIIKCVPSTFSSEISIPPLLRFCFHYWNSEEEVDKAVNVLRRLAKKHKIGV